MSRVCWTGLGETDAEGKGRDPEDRLLSVISMKQMNTKLRGGWRGNARRGSKSTY